MAEFEEVTQAATEERLASRGERFAAAVIDIVISILASLPFFFYTGLEALENPDMTLVVTGLVYSILIYIVINGYLLFHFGQTVGKRFLNIRIEDLQTVRLVRPYSADAVPAGSGCHQHTFYWRHTWPYQHCIYLQERPSLCS